MPNPMEANPPRFLKGEGEQAKQGKTPMVDQLATDLTALAEETKLDPVIGRQNGHGLLSLRFIHG